MVRKLTKNESGFSLIELLITVVIIGVLAAMGVPQYRKMVSKSRTAEAKVMLGAIYTAETALAAEYGTFGNNIKAMGVNISSPQTYVAGFPGSAACVEPTVFPASGTAPNLTGSGYGEALANTSQVSGGVVGLGIAPNNVAPFPTAVQSQCGSAAAAPTTTAFTAIASGNAVNARVVCTASGADPYSATSGRCDMWSINQNGTLSNLTVGF